MIQIQLPFIRSSGRPASTPFVAEGAPAPVHDFARFDRSSRAAGTRNEHGSLLDAGLFSASPVTPEAPPGLQHGVTPILSAGTKGQDGVADDLGLSAQTTSSNGSNADNIWLLLPTALLATKLRRLVTKIRQPSDVRRLLTEPS